MAILRKSMRHGPVQEVKVAEDNRAVGNVDLKNLHVTHGDKDELELAAMGKKQVLRRMFGFWSTMGLSLSSTITYEGLLVVFLYGLWNGGPAGLVYGFLFCWAGYLASMASMGELVSAIPTAGGQYHWVYILAPEQFKNVLSYVTGWLTVIAWQAGTASTCYLGGTLVQGLLVMDYPGSVYERWQGTLLLFAVAFIALFVNTVMARLLPAVEWGILIVHLSLFLGTLVPLVYLAPEHATGGEVFARFLTLGGYEDKGLTFFVGIVSATFAFVGADGAVHICEEVHNATTVVPWCMVGAILINGTLGFGMLLAVLFSIGSIPAAIGATTTTGFPFLEIFQQAVGTVKGVTAMASFIVAIVIFASISLFAATAGLTWAFARDKGLPGSRWLSYVEPRTKIPIWSCFLTCLVSCLLSLINNGSSAAFNAIVSLVVSGFLGSYIIPLSLLIYLRFFHPSQLRFGPWTLGRAGSVVNIVALVWAIIAMVFSSFPASIPVDAATMNWSCLLFGGTMIFAGMFYVVYGRSRYRGPVVEITLAEVVA